MISSHFLSGFQDFLLFDSHQNLIQFRIDFKNPKINLKTITKHEAVSILYQCCHGDGTGK